MVGGTVCAEATKDPTHSDHDAAASSALTGRDALFANLGADMISGKINALSDQRKQMLEEKKGCGTCEKCAAAENAIETQSQ